MPNTQKDKKKLNEDEIGYTSDDSEISNEDIPEKSQNEEVSLASEAESLKKELLEMNGQYLRLAAEYDNFRKRSQREKESAYNDSKAYTLSQILPVVDNFERATANTAADFKDYRKGIEMIFGQFIEILSKFDVEAFGEEGEPFDPELHNAVMHIEDENLESNIIAEVFQNGYKIGDKVIRHAVVKVAN